MTKLLQRLTKILMILTLVFFQSRPFQISARIALEETKDVRILTDNEYELHFDTNGSRNFGVGDGNYESIFDSASEDIWFNDFNLTIGADADALAAHYGVVPAPIPEVPDSVFIGFKVVDIHFDPATGDLDFIGVSAVHVLRPIVANDSYSINEDTTLTEAVPGVLGNDTNPEIDNGYTMTAVKTSDPSHGTVDFNNDGSFTYTPNANWNGTDQFTYKAYISTASSTNDATVSISVTPVNDAPTANAGSFTVLEGGTYTSNLVPNNLTGTDPEGSTLTFTKVINTSSGSVTVNSDGTFVYIHNGTESFIDLFSFKVNDGSLDSTPAMIFITIIPVDDDPVVNTAPEAVNDFITTLEDVAIDIAVLANDTDVDNDVLFIDYLFADSRFGPAHGTVSINADRTTVRYTPDLDYNGPDSFTYRVSDGYGGRDTAVVSITVTPVNDSATAYPDFITILEDTSVDINVLANDIVGEGQDFIIDHVGGTSFGTTSLNPDGTIHFVPLENFVGTVAFLYSIRGQSTAWVFVTITSVNDAPIANPQAFTVDNDASHTGVLVGSDIEGDALLYAIITAPVNGTITSFDNVTGAFTYNHYGSATLSDSFTFTVQEDEENGLVSVSVTVSITVNAKPTPPPVNLPPTAFGLSITVTDGGSASGTLTGFDPEGIALLFFLSGTPGNGSALVNSNGTFTYNHNGNAATSDSFTFYVNDWAFDSALATVSVTIVQPTPPLAPNTAPSANNGSGNTPFETPFEGQTPGTDADGDPLTFILVGGPNNGLLDFNPDGSFTYTPNADFEGSDSFTFRTNDGTDDSNTATFTINVGEEVIIVEPVTPEAALPLNLSWMYWLVGLMAALINFLAFLRPNIKYKLIGSDGTIKTIRRRLAKPDSDIMFIELTDKGMENLVDVNVEIYKRLAKHLDNVTVSFMLRNRVVQTVTIPKGQDDAYNILIHL